MQQRETAAIPKLVLSTQDRLLRQIVISKPRLTIGRRPYNDIMLDDLTVSGEHAVLHTRAGESVVHDLKSRNGTLVNGEPVMQRALVDGDRIEIGIYRLRYVVERLPGDAESTVADEPFGLAEVRVLSGASAGTTLRLERAITSIGNGAGAGRRRRAAPPRLPHHPSGRADVPAGQRRVDRPDRASARPRGPDRAGRDHLPVSPDPRV